MHQAAMLTEIDSLVKQKAGTPGCEQWDTVTFTFKEKYPENGRKVYGDRERVLLFHLGTTHEIKAVVPSIQFIGVNS